MNYQRCFVKIKGLWCKYKYKSGNNYLLVFCAQATFKLYLHRRSFARYPVFLTCMFLSVVPISVALPKLAKASTDMSLSKVAGVIMSMGVIANKCRQCK